MDALYPMVLPYGLSGHHRYVQKTGKNVALPLGHPLFYLPSLRQLSLPTPTDNPPGFVSVCPPRPSLFRAVKPTLRKSQPKMGIPCIRKTIKMPRSAKQRRSRSPKLKPKPQPQPQRQSRSRRGRPPGWLQRTAPFGPGTRLKAGEQAQSPILIEDSDGDEKASTSKITYPASTSAQRRATVGITSWLQDSVRRPSSSRHRYSPAPSLSEDECGFLPKKDPPQHIPVPSVERQPSEESVVIVKEKRRDRDNYAFSAMDARLHQRRLFSYPTPAKTENGLDSQRTTPLRSDDVIMQDASAIHGDDYPCRGRPTTMRELKKVGRARRVKEPSPARSRRRRPAEHTLPSTHKSHAPETSPVHSREWPVKSSIESSFATKHTLSLADIPDYTLRPKVAQLMAVAPAIPIPDLYDLLIEKEGHYREARDYAVRHFSQSHMPRPSAFLSSDSKGRAITRDEEVEVKIDLDDPDIWMDNDVAPSPSPPPRRPRQKSKSSSTIHTPRSCLEQTSNAKQKPEQSRFTEANRNIKRQKGDQSRGPHDMNEMYVTSDNESSSDFDEYSEEKDDSEMDYASGEDVDMGDLDKDLYIDMIQPFLIKNEKNSD